MGIARQTCPTAVRLRFAGRHLDRDIRVVREYLAGSLVVLMLSGGEALETYAVRSASAVLQALAKRLPAIAHLKREAGVVDVPLNQVAVGNAVLIYPIDLPGRWSGDGGTRCHGRVVPDGRTFSDVENAGLGRVVGAINGDAMLTSALPSWRWIRVTPRSCR